MSLRSLGSDLLTVSNSEEGESDERCRVEHDAYDCTEIQGDGG